MTNFQVEFKIQAKKELLNEDKKRSVSEAIDCQTMERSDQDYHRH